MEYKVFSWSMTETTADTPDGSTVICLPLSTVTLKKSWPRINSWRGKRGNSKEKFKKGRSNSFLSVRQLRTGSIKTPLS